ESERTLADSLTLFAAYKNKQREMVPQNASGSEFAFSVECSHVGLSGLSGGRTGRPDGLSVCVCTLSGDARRLSQAAALTLAYLQTA
ncbi:hypothetical protein, partial [Pseudomonas aeruginosa]|uniref:hypothetical protein n=1 Tax=Pseudomonas aeruginosa TaxID=287 RepID=UPI00345B3056